MRSFIDIVNGKALKEPSSLLLLENKQQYHSMFAKFLSRYDAHADVFWSAKGGLPDPAKAGARETVKANVRKEINKHIEWAREYLRKQDRIVWFLRYVRATLYAENKELEAEPGPHIGPGTLGHYRNADSPYGIRHGLATALTHYMGMPIAAIQNHVFGNEEANKLLDHFEELEEEWNKQYSEWFQDDESEVIVDCGEGWYWVNTGKPFCDKESKAMGHCGNSPRRDSADNLLSLRQKKVVDGVTLWRPSLTFIRDDEGLLTEMKGRANGKPDKKYHPQIIALLKSGQVRGITGGGYRPENNFAMSDLTDEQFADVLRSNHEMGDSLDYYRLLGADKTLEQKIVDEVMDTTRTYIERVDGEKVLLISFRDFATLNSRDESLDMVEEIGQRSFSYGPDFLNETLDWIIEEDDSIQSWFPLWRDLLEKHGLWEDVIRNTGRHEGPGRALQRMIAKNVGFKTYQNSMDYWRGQAKILGQAEQDRICQAIIDRSAMITDIVHDEEWEIWSSTSYVVHALRAYRNAKAESRDRYRDTYPVEPTSDQYAEFIICARETRYGDRGWLRGVNSGKARLVREGDGLIEKIEKQFLGEFLDMIKKALSQPWRLGSK